MLKVFASFFFFFLFSHFITPTQAKAIVPSLLLLPNSGNRKQSPKGKDKWLRLRLESLFFLETLSTGNETAATIYPDWRNPDGASPGFSFSGNDGRGSQPTRLSDDSIFFIDFSFVFRS